MFERTATRETLLALYDAAAEEQGRRVGLSGSLERRTAFAEKLGELDDAERRGYLRQEARGLLTDRELEEMLAEVKEQREVIAVEMRRVEEATTTARGCRRLGHPSQRPADSRTRTPSSRASG